MTERKGRTRIRWDKIFAAFCAVAILIALVADVMKPTPEAEIRLHYEDTFYTVEKGDTVWSICAERTPDDMDIRDMERWVIQRNNIFDAANLPEGRVLIVPELNRKGETK